MSRIHLVRHGLSESNLDIAINKRKADHAINLAPEGVEQAAEAGNFLADHIQTGVPGFHKRRIKMLISPYARTRQTAEGIKAGLRKQGLEFEEVELLALREQEFGLFDGLLDDELKEIYPREHAHYAKHTEFAGEFFAPMPLGESRIAVCDRVRTTFSSIIDDMSGDRGPVVTDTIVVSHGVTIRCFITEFLHKKWEWCEQEPNPNNCSIRTIEGSRGGNWTLNETFKGFPHKARSSAPKSSQAKREEGHV